MNNSIQSQGGIARAKALTPEKRSQIARAAADKRWGQRQELLIPVSGLRVVRVPIPLEEDDIEIIFATLDLWKEKITTKAHSDPQ